MSELGESVELVLIGKDEIRQRETYGCSAAAKTTLLTTAHEYSLGMTDHYLGLQGRHWLEQLSKVVYLESVELNSVQMLERRSD